MAAHKVLVLAACLVLAVNFAAGVIDSKHKLYKGCFRDYEHRQLDQFFQTYHDLTPEKCIDQCKGRGYEYAGVEFGNQCYCGHFLPQRKVSDKDCNMDCEGPVRAKCGAAWRISVYEANT